MLAQFEPLFLSPDMSEINWRRDVKLVACEPHTRLFVFFFPGLLEISPVERGVVTIFGVQRGLFVAMNSKGKLYGSVSAREDLRLISAG